MAGYPRGTVSYKPIASYGLVGNTITAALIATDGSVDWCCLPRFDAPSTFAALLDHEKGGALLHCARHTV
jgi:GH15 family glucan-1,4-alpha-glucosidase